MICTLLLYVIVDTDGSPSASPRVEVALGLVRQLTSSRAGGSARIVEQASKLATGREAPEQTLLAPPPWRNKRSLVTLCRSISEPRGAYTLKKTNK